MNHRYYRTSNWTGRTHRCLEDAFGPHAGKQIQEPPEPLQPADIVIAFVLAPMVVAILVAIAAGWL